VEIVQNILRKMIIYKHKNKTNLYITKLNDDVVKLMYPYDDFNVGYEYNLPESLIVKYFYKINKKPNYLLKQ